MGRDTKLQSKRVQVHTEAVTPITLQLIKDLSKQDFVKDFHLAGGTALALQIGHRLSVDLDFFSLSEFNPRSWLNKLGKLGEVSNIQIGESNLLCFINGVKVEFIYFAYPPKHPYTEMLGLKLLDPVDIGMLKLLAIVGRNRKKDILDLYCIDKDVMPLKKLFQEFISSFDEGDINLLKQVELLFDEKQIEKSEMPVMLREVEWKEAYLHVKRVIGEEIARLVRSEMQLPSL